MQEIDNKNENKRAILKSTTLLGGSSLINILIGMVRTKIIAILLGPSGVGLMGVFSSLQQIVSTVTGFGLNSSGVRQIAHSKSSNDEKAVATTVKSLRITIWITGSLGLLVMIVGSKILSQLSFKTEEYAASIALLGLSVLFAAISSGQSCVLQGFRRIKDVAKISIIGAINGTIIGIPCYFLWGKNGIVPSMILASFASLISSWWFSHRVQIAEVKFSYQVVSKEANKLIVFGIPLMLSSLITTAVSYVTRIYLNREAGLDAVGQYQAAFSLASVLVNFVLSAMSTDYYPRLTALSHDNQKINEEVNSQTEIALLLAVPAIVATISFMPFIMRIFYSSRFDNAIPILRWAVFGILGRVISWPMGYIILAKAKGALLFFTEFISGAFNILALVICYQLIGLPGTGLSFALLYVFHIGLMSIISRKLCGFKWDKKNIKFILQSIIIIIILSIIGTLTINEIIKIIIGVMFFFITGFICINRLMQISGITFQMIKAKILK